VRDDSSAEISARKGSGKSRQRCMSGIMMVQARNRRAKTHLATRRSVI